LIEAHVLAAERLHGDDTPVPVLARGKTDKGRLWVYVSDDRPFAGGAPPAALFKPVFPRCRGFELTLFADSSIGIRDIEAVGRAGNGGCDG
jgi:hypothetical protein